MIAALLLASIFSIFSAARRDARIGADRYRRGKFAESAQRFGEAHRREPGDPAWTLDLGTALGAAGKIDSARAKLQEAARAEADPRIAADALFQEGTLEIQDRKYSEAVEALRRSLVLDPSRPDAQRNYEIALKNSRQPKPPPGPAAGTPPSADRKNPSRPEPTPQKERENSQFEKKAGMTREEAQALLRSLDAEQRQHEKIAAAIQGKDW